MVRRYESERERREMKETIKFLKEEGERRKKMKKRIKGKEEEGYRWREMWQRGVIAERIERMQ